jgi:hypothetical protein
MLLVDTEDFICLRLCRYIAVIGEIQEFVFLPPIL